jgi:DNA-directed RNA polymerase subunit RPC12/RpoP
MTDPLPMSNWLQATRTLMCPKCGSTDLVGPGIAPTLEKQQDGSYVCLTCAHAFRAPPEHEADP